MNRGLFNPIRSHTSIDGHPQSRSNAFANTLLQRRYHKPDLSREFGSGPVPHRGTLYSISRSARLASAVTFWMYGPLWVYWTAMYPARLKSLRIAVTVRQWIRW